MIILAVFVGQYIYICETLVKFSICFLMTRVLNRSMLSYRFVLTTATHCCITCQRVVLSDYRKYRIRRRAKTPQCDHISEVLVSLHWLRIEQRIIYKIHVLTFKDFVDHSTPIYLSELMKKKSSSTNTRSANDFFVSYPTTK